MNNESTISNELPKGWVTAPLDSLCQKFRGVSYGKDDASAVPKKGYVPILRANNLQNDRLTFDDLVWVPADCVSDQQKLRAGDIVVAMSSGSKSIVGKTAQVMEDWQGSFGAFCGVLRAWPELNSRYVGMFLRTREYRNTISELAAGSNINNLKNEHLAAIEVPVAPLPEQQLIVAKLETMLGKVDVSQQRLTKISVLLKRFRQSVLSAACAGCLTTDWREENENIPTADTLIKDAQFEIAQSEIELPELPEKWNWVALGNYARCFRGRFSPRPRNDPRYFNGKHPFIQIGNLPREGGLVSSHVQTLNDEGLAVSRKFPKGTVVIAIVGATIGNTGVLAYEMCVTDSIVGLETGDELGNRYVELFLRHKKDDVRQISYSSGGQPNINLAVLNPYPLALPPLAEQQEIVRRVEGLFALADQLELRLKMAISRVRGITPSLLARAFAGKLVSQNSADEPAEKLLARIKNFQTRKVK
jgi:type I restriction enzyme S subunit